MKTKELKEKYEFICNEFVAKFEKKQQIDFEGWVDYEIGGIASFSFQYYFNLSDIIFDLKTNQPKGCIKNWSNEETDFNVFNKNPQHINYKSYTMGLRHENLIKKNAEKLYKEIILNAIQTPDGTVLISKNRYDYVCHKDDNGSFYSVDGGNFYVKRSCEKNDYKELSVFVQKKSVN
jgi:hypothetical protein